jgi:hypothetical protein
MNISRTHLKLGFAAFVLAALAATALLVHRHHNPPTAFDPEGLRDYYTALRVQPSTPVPDAAVSTAAAGATTYIRRVIDPAGQFQYTVNMDPAVPVIQDYSILRHQGTVFALGSSNDLAPDPANIEVMRRAVDYMRKCCYAEIPGQPQIAAVREPAHVAKQSSRFYFKLGGAGLGLLALTSLERHAPGSVPRDEMSRMSQFGQYLQNRDGSFYSLYYEKAGKRGAYNKSLYYPGEMAMGWIAMHQLAPAEDALAAAEKALLFLSKTRWRQGFAPADHWALLATARLFQVADTEKIEIPREALINHTLQVCHAILEDGRHVQPLPVMEGSLVPNGIVTPTATRLEGLQAALTYLPPNHPIVPHIRSAVDRGIDFLVRAQVKDGSYAGGMPHKITRLPDDGTEATRKFNAEATEIRIDYIQHSLSALVQYLQRDRVP